jgi:psiF repeat
MKMKAIILGLTAAVLAAGGAYAADTKAATDTTKPAMTSTAKPMNSKPMTAKGDTMKKPRSEISKTCSADADVQKLHGKARKTFRKACMMKAQAA